MTSALGWRLFRFLEFVLPSPDSSPAKYENEIRYKGGDRRGSAQSVGGGLEKDKQVIAAACDVFCLPFLALLFVFQQA